MKTFSGENIDFNDPKLDNIKIIDVAHALSHICRFVGHTPTFYSVADHSLNVMRWLKKEGNCQEIQYAGLLHDAHEAYIGDLIRPVKIHTPLYRAMESTFKEIVTRTFSIPRDSTGAEAVEKADNIILVLEAKHFFPRTNLWIELGNELFPGKEIDDGFEIHVSDTPGAAKYSFLRRFFSLQP
jgi:5'-deoxynucleotidase YfbR-like HD superfamily hydrolase